MTIISLTTIFFLIIISSEAQETLVLKDSMDKISICTYLSIYEDTTGIQQYEDISDPNFSSNFKKNVQAVPNLGFSNSSFWFKISILDSSTRPRDWILDIAIPGLHLINFFITTDDTTLQKCHSGFVVGQKYKATSFRNPSVQLNTNPGHCLYIYIQIKSETPIITPVYLREKDQYITYDRNREFFFGLYFGALLIMACYHFYLFILTRDQSYLWLVLFTICFGLGQMTAVYGYLADWGIPNPGQHLNWLHVINYLAAFFALILSREMILSKQFTPICDNVLKVIQTSTIICTFISPFLKYMLAERILLLFNILPVPLLIYSSIIAYHNNHKPSLYYLMAASSFITGIIIYNFMYGFSVFPYNTFLYFIPNITFVITLSLFSIGLADKINTIKKEREQAQKQALINVSEKLLLQNQNEAIASELEDAKKSAIIGRVLSGVAHDINNFLNPIIGYSLLIRNKCQANEFIAKPVDSLINATHSLKDLSTSLLDISRKKTKCIAVMDLNKAARQISSLLKHSSPTGISIKMNLHENELLTAADAGLVHSAILNIGLNAIDAMSDGGTMSITTDCIKLTREDPMLNKFGAPEGIYVTVTIQDTGIGMDQKILNHIFEPFFTTKSDGRGTGLGLFGVYNCMKKHNGCIDVYSKPGEGSRITLFFRKIELTSGEMNQYLTYEKLSADIILFNNAEESHIG